jgi:membrane-bound ClpP family serine protease
MNSLTMAILLQSAGVVVVIAEIIIPSGGLISVIALMLFGYSLFLVFHNISVATGIVFITADVIIIPVLILVGLRLLARSPAMLKRELSRAAGVTSQSAILVDYLGKEGTASSDLRPAGRAEIEGKRVDVVSRGEYIEKGSAIVVTAVTGNQIIVRPKNVTSDETVTGP